MPKKMRKLCQKAPKMMPKWMQKSADPWSGVLEHVDLGGGLPSPHPAEVWSQSVHSHSLRIHQRVRAYPPTHLHAAQFLRSAAYSQRNFLAAQFLLFLANRGGPRGGTQGLGPQRRVPQAPQGWPKGQGAQGALRAPWGEGRLRRPWGPWGPLG